MIKLYIIALNMYGYFNQMSTFDGLLLGNHPYLYAYPSCVTVGETELNLF